MFWQQYCATMDDGRSSGKGNADIQKEREADSTAENGLRHCDSTLSVVRRFGGEPQLMSNGNRCLMDLMSIGFNV